MGEARPDEGRHRAVVGLYGDPSTSWGIGVEVGLRSALRPSDAGTGLRELAAAYPHLGPVGPVDEVQAPDWEDRRVDALAAPYAPDAPLVRVLVCPERAGSARLLVAAHHGVCDGLGLLSIVSACAGTSVRPTTAGVGDRAASGSFLARAPLRLVEALRRPPPRFPRVGPPGETGEQVTVRRGPRTSAGTVALCLALARAFAERSRPHGRRGPEHPLFFVGASRRAPGALAPDRCTAYLRFRVDPGWSRKQAVTEFARVAPEPDFPETSLGGVGPLLVRPFRNRLGSTAVVSNLGVLEGDVDWLAMYPALSGPRAVSIGATSTDQHTTLSVRTRTQELSRDDASALLDRVADEVFGQ